MLFILALAALFSSLSVAAQEPLWTDIIFGNIQEAERIVFAIDNSGSVKETRLSLEKSAAATLIKTLSRTGRNPRVEVITFNSDISVIVPLAPFNDVKDSIIPAINSIPNTDKLTWMNGAIDYACSITQLVHPNGALFLSTDGLPTTPERNGSRDDDPARDKTRAAAENFKENCSTLAVIGIEVSGEDEEFLRAIASPGAYVTVTPETIPAVGQWGMIVLGVLLAGSLAWMIRKKGLGNISA